MEKYYLCTVHLYGHPFTSDAYLSLREVGKLMDKFDVYVVIQDFVNSPRYGRDYYKELCVKFKDFKK